MSELITPEENNEEAVKALEAFCELYEPSKNVVSDFFSTKQILHIVSEHTGYYFGIAELYQMLKSMGYKYELQGDEFAWLCNRVGKSTAE